MIPILHAPGVITPGQFGPMSLMLLPCSARFTRTMSTTGMPSVMAIINSMPASAASRIASAANAAGTKMQETLAAVSRTASPTVLNTGISCESSSTTSPPRPGVTPPTSFVPYLRHCSAWNFPAEPVMPWTIRRVWASTRMLMDAPGRASHGQPPSNRRCGNRSSSTGTSRRRCRAALPHTPARTHRFRCPVSRPPAGGPRFRNTSRVSCWLLRGLDDFLRGVGHRIGGNDGQAAFLEDLLAQLDIGAFETHDERHADVHLLDGGENAVGDHV